MNTKKYLLVIISVIFSITGYYAYALDGWLYYREIAIDNTGNSNTLTDYQVLVTVDTATIISEGKMNNDCSDIRFIDSDGVTELSYWIEDGTCNTTTTRIWVKVPSIPASSTYTIQMWYGNPSAIAVSSIDNTFIFGDDFNSNGLNTTKWYYNTVGSYSVSDGMLTVTGGTSSWQLVGSKSQFTAPVILTAKIKLTETQRHTFGLDDRSATGNYIGAGYDYALISFITSATYLTSVEGSYVENPRTSSLTSFTIVNIYWTSNSVTYDDGYITTVTTNIPVDPMGIAFWSYNTETNITADWVVIRKYTSPEPTASVIDKPIITISGIDNETYFTSYFNITYYATDITNNIILKAWFDGTLIYENTTYLSGTILQYNTDLLQEGQHNFTVMAVNSYNKVDYQEILFTVDDYKLINYSFTPYQYEDEKYRYSIKLLINEYLFNKSKLYFIYNGSVTSYEYIEPEIIIPLPSLPYTYHFNTSMDELDVSITDNCLPPPTICYGGVDIRLYLNGNVVYSNRVYDGQVIKEKYDTIEFVSKGINVVDANFIAKKYDSGFIAYVTNPLINTNATNVNFEWLYDKNGVNETIFSNTTTLMWRSWLSDITTYDGRSNYWEGEEINFYNYLSVVLTYENETATECNYKYAIKNSTLKSYFNNNVELLNSNVLVERSIAKNGDCSKFYTASLSISENNKKLSFFNDSISKSKISYSEFYVLNYLRNNLSTTINIWHYDMKKCDTTYTKNLLTNTLRKEEDYSLDIGTIRNELVLSTSDGHVVDTGYFYDNGVSTQQICLYGNYPTELTFNLLLNGDIYYKNNNMTSERSYFLNNVSYIGNEIKTELYTINPSITDNFLVTFNIKDEFGNNLEGVQVKILKLNESTNAYYTLTIVSTDVNGNAYTYLEVEKYYKFILIYNGIVYYVSNPVQLYQNQYSFVIKLTEGGINPVIVLEGVDYDCSVSDDEQTLSCYVNDNTNKVVASRLVVWKRNNLYKQLVYNNYVSSATAYYNYTITENKTHEYNFYINIDGYGWFLAKQGVFNEYKRDVFSGRFLFESLILVLIVALLGARNPQLTIIMTGVGFIITYAFGFASFSYAFVIAAIIVGLIALWRMRS